MSPTEKTTNSSIKHSRVTRAFAAAAFLALGTHGALLASSDDFTVLRGPQKKEVLVRGPMRRALFGMASTGIIGGHQMARWLMAKGVSKPTAFTAGVVAATALLVPDAACGAVAGFVKGVAAEESDALIAVGPKVPRIVAVQLAKHMPR